MQPAPDPPTPPPNPPPPPPALWTAQVPLVRQQQEQSDWCWAATTSAVAKTYDPNSTWTQGAIVDGMITPPPPAAACSVDGSTDACNQPMRLDTALQDTKTLANGSPLAAPISFADIQNEINNGRPLGARIAWSGGGAHFVALSGFDATNQRLLIADPLWGVADYSYADFCNAYRAPGNTWTHAYLTVPNVPYAPSGGGSPVPVKRVGAPPSPAVGRPAQSHLNWAISRYVDVPPTGTANVIDVYFLGLSDAANATAPDVCANARRIGSRAFYDTGTDVISVEIDFDANGSRDPHMSTGQGATEAVVSAQRQQNPNAEIRLLKVPGINLQLVWVAKPDGDLFIPLTPTPTAFQSVPSPLDEPTLATIVRQLAARQLSFQDV